MPSDALKLLKDHVHLMDAPDPHNAPLLPQSHREEVAWFARVSAGIAAEQDTITPEEFQEFLGLMPRLFPGLLRGGHQLLRTPKGTLDFTTCADGAYNDAAIIQA